MVRVGRGDAMHRRAPTSSSQKPSVRSLPSPSPLQDVDAAAEGLGADGAASLRGGGGGGGEDLKTRGCDEAVNGVGGGGFEDPDVGGSEALNPGKSQWKGMRGEWWMRSEPSRPVLRGIDFALDSQYEGDTDEVYFVPDSDDEVYQDLCKSKGNKSEFVPYLEPPDAHDVEGNSTEDFAIEHKQNLNQRQPLGLMFKHWRRALFLDDNLGDNQQLAETEINQGLKDKVKKECDKMEISLAEAETDGKGVGVEMPLPQVKAETKKETSIEDAETDDEGVRVGVHLPDTQDATITELVSLFVPAYKQVSKRRRT